MSPSQKDTFPSPPPFFPPRKLFFSLSLSSVLEIPFSSSPSSSSIHWMPVDAQALLRLPVAELLWWWGRREGVGEKRHLISGRKTGKGRAWRRGGHLF